MNQVPWLKPWPRWEYAKPIEAPFLQSLPSLRWFYALAGNLHVPVLGWVWRMRRSEVRSPTTPSRVCTMSRLYCFACAPNAESTNDMAHMQQSYFCPRKGCNIIVTLCEASRLVADDSVVFRFCSVGWTTDEMVLDKTQAVHPGFAILAIVVGWTQVSLPRACYMCVCSDVTDLIFIAWPCCARALSS